MLIHLSRTLANVLHGYVHRVKPGTAKALMPALTPDKPHVYRARCALADVDLFAHMNNSAYLVHAEMARWNVTTMLGLLPYIAKRRLAFLVVHNSAIYKKPIAPLQEFRIDTVLADWSDREAVFLHTFRDTQERLLAQIVCRAVFRELGPGGKFCSAEEIVSEGLGVELGSPAALCSDAVLSASRVLNLAMRDEV